MVPFVYFPFIKDADFDFHEFNLFATRSRAVLTALNQKFTALVYGNLRPEFQGIWGRDHTWIDYYKPFRSCLVYS